jgi:PAS domain S-box-containing protein
MTNPSDTGKDMSNTPADQTPSLDSAGLRRHAKGPIRDEGSLNRALKELDILQAVMNGASNSHLVYLDRDFNFVRVNETYAHTCGYRPEQMIGKNHFVLYPHAENEAIFARVRDTGKPVTFHDKPFVFPDQPERGVTYWDWTLTPVKDPNGEVTGLVFSLFETTAHKRIEQASQESEKHYRSLFDNMLNGVAYCKMLYDGDRPVNFIYLDINTSFERLTGLKGVVGKKVTDVISGIRESDPEIFEIYGRVASTGRPKQFERYVKALEMWFSVSTYSYEKDHFVAVFDIITERKRSEEALRSAHDELEKRVLERTSDLEIMNEALRQSNIALEDFVHVAAHDLQEPLRKIMTFADRVMSIEEDCLRDQSRDYLARMTRAAGRMQSLIRDLVKYARDTSHPDHFRIMNLKEPVEEAVKDLSILLEESEGRIEIDELPDVEADKVQMHRLFINLLNNALKYHGDKKPLIRIYTRPSSEDKFHEIHVKDNGIGFEEKYLNKIFKPFQRLHRTNSPYSGTGMGLAICRKIVEHHGGIITARSEPGKGSTFIVRLPKQASKRFKV